MDRLDLLAVQGTLKSLLQHYNRSLLQHHINFNDSPRCQEFRLWPHRQNGLREGRDFFSRQLCPIVGWSEVPAKSLWLSPLGHLASLGSQSRWDLRVALIPMLALLIRRSRLEPARGHSERQAGRMRREVLHFGLAAAHKPPSRCQACSRTRSDHMPTLLQSHWPCPFVARPKHPTPLLLTQGFHSHRL